MTEAMLERVQLEAGDRVLELACGPGGVGLAAASRVGPEGEAVLTDVAVEMTQIAAKRAEDAGLRNVTTRQMDIESIDEADASYDAVLSRAGIMFATDPAHALEGIARVLRPGGRAALAVWGPRGENPWLGLLMDSVSAQLGAPVPPPGIPGPFALGDAEKLGSLLREADFSDVQVEEVEVPMEVGSFDEWWTRTVALAGPLAKIIENMPEEGMAAVRDRARVSTAAFETSDGLRFPGLGLLASGRR